MDTRKFDDLTRSLALGKSRRSVIKGLFGGVVGTVAIAGRPAYGAFAGVEAECGTDTDCMQGEICCGGVCAAIECCTDDANPNDRCPEGTSCFEGYCDPILGCGSDEECAADEICCEGVCAAIECCMGDANPNDRCPEGTSCFEGYCDTLCDIVGCGDGECCCEDGKSCSADCCDAPITVLPAAGSGTASNTGAWVAAAAVGGAAAYLAGRKIRTPETDSTVD